MKTGLVGLVATLLTLSSSPAPAANTADETAIRQTLSIWTDVFNAGDAGKVCDIFEPGVIADIRPVPPQSYELICDRLKGVVTDKSRRYRYAQPDIKEIIVSGDMAVVRLIWTLTMTGGGKPDATSVESGMDIFRRQPDGSWKIMRWMSYN